MEKLRAIWQDVVESLWFLPALLTLAGAALAVVLVRYDDEIRGSLDAGEVWWLFGGGSDGAKSVLEAIAGSMMTVTGVIFSVTIIALQLASNQYTPRVLRQFMADRANQLVLGVFIGTFTYSLLVLRTVRSSNGAEAAFIPSVAVTGSVFLTLASLGCLIYFINHLARSIQAERIVDSVARTSVRILDTIYPDELREGSMPPPTMQLETPVAPADSYDVRARQSGYVQAVEREALRRFASDHDLLIRLEVEIGAHVLPGQLIMKIWPGGRITTAGEERLLHALVLGSERTPHQDIRHGIIEMMDIAVKALSPGINDPTTAVNVIQRQAEVLLDMAWRECGAIRDRDDGGRLRVILPRPALRDVSDLAFNQIRHFGSSNPTVAIALLDTLAELAALSPEDARSAFTEQLHGVITTVRAQAMNPFDTARVEDAIDRAVTRSQVIPPRQRPHR